MSERLRTNWAGFVAFLFITGSGCTLHRVNTAPAPRVEVPSAFSSEAAATGAGTVPDQWWQVFGSAELDGLVQSVLDQSLDMKRAWARMAQANAILSGAEAARMPVISGDAGLSGSRSIINLAEPIGRVTNDNVNYSLGVSAAYEVDIWGKAAARESAAEVDVKATRQDLEALAMALAGQVVETWMAIAGERDTLTLMDEQVAIAKKFAEVIELRFAQGLATALSLYQQRQQVAAIESQRPLIEGRIRTFEHRLAVLMGQAPRALNVANGEARALPEPAPLPDVGIPTRLLDKRPDVRAARLRIVAADHRVGAAIADQYPTLSLSARTGFQSNDIVDLFTSWIYNLAANLVGPLFDGGRRAAEVERARGQIEDLVHGYGQAVLTALREVEDALVQEQKQREYLERVEGQLVFAKKSLGEAQLRYINGLSDYLNVLQALSTVQSVEQTMLGARRQLISYRVALYRALGGDWTAELAAPARQQGKTQASDAAASPINESGVDVPDTPTGEADPGEDTHE